MQKSLASIPTTPSTTSTEHDSEKTMAFEEHINDQLWRLNNLYWVVDENGNEVQFNLRPWQKWLFERQWFLNIVLKARQLGFTTYIDIFLLDEALFTPNLQCAIIAHTREAAQDIFDKKIKFAFDRLDPQLKAKFNVNTDNIRVLKFANGSSISVIVSARSGTVNRLHVTELATLATKYPEKAQEVITGSLNAVHAGQMVFIESTAQGMDDHFHRLCKIAMDNAKAKKPLTPLDYQFYFFPWYLTSEYRIEDVSVRVPKHMEEYFDKLEQEIGQKLDIAQRRWYVKKAEIMSEAMQREYPSTPEEAFRASLEGAYFSKEMALARREHRITRVPYEPRLPVTTFWDIGIEDYTSIWFLQPYGQEIRLIDFYENSGEGLPHYAGVLKEKGYVYASHIAPHDIEVREMGSGRSRKEIASSLGISFWVAPQQSIMDGIEAVRSLFRRFWFDEEHCALGITHLDNYKKEWDDIGGQWKAKPFHDKHSHAADALRIGAMTFIDVPLSEQRDVHNKPVAEPPYARKEDDEVYQPINYYK